MTLRVFLDKIVVLLLLISLCFICTTSIAIITQSNDWNRVFGINLHRILELVDLRRENTVATWFSSCIFLLTGMAFYLLGWGTSANYTISRQRRFLFQIVALGAVFLSADEVASVHETVGVWVGRALIGDTSGYIWVVVFAPVLLAGFAVTVHCLRELIISIPILAIRRKAITALYVALLCLPSVLLFEAGEWYMNSIHNEIALFTILESIAEESFEILGMLSLLFSVTLIAKFYEL